MSAAPGKIVRTYTIEMRRPRKVETLGPELLAVQAEILGLLKPPGAFLGLFEESDVAQRDRQLLRQDFQGFLFPFG